MRPPTRDARLRSCVVDFECPRCQEHVTEVYFGPCGGCRQALRASLARAARQVDVAEYEPKVNVTPNAVALRDD